MKGDMHILLLKILGLLIILVILMILISVYILKVDILGETILSVLSPFIGLLS